MKRPLLGRDWLNAVPNWNNRLQVNEVNEMAINTNSLNTILQKYADDFDPKFRQNIGSTSTPDPQRKRYTLARALPLPTRNARCALQYSMCCVLSNHATNTSKVFCFFRFLFSFMHCHDRKYALILTRNTNTVSFYFIKNFIET